MVRVFIPFSIYVITIFNESVPSYSDSSLSSFLYEILLVLVGHYFSNSNIYIRQE